jgi:hypothetical protein
VRRDARSRAGVRRQTVARAARAEAAVHADDAATRPLDRAPLRSGDRRNARRRVAVRGAQRWTRTIDHRRRSSRGAWGARSRDGRARGQAAEASARTAPAARSRRTTGTARAVRTREDRRVTDPHTREARVGATREDHGEAERPVRRTGDARSRQDAHDRADTRARRRTRRDRDRQTPRVPAVRRHGQRQDRGLSASALRSGAPRPTGDRARAGDRADAADRRAFPRALQTRGRVALALDRRGTSSAMARDPARRSGRDHRRALGGVRAPRLGSGS